MIALTYNLSLDFICFLTSLVIHGKWNLLLLNLLGTNVCLFDVKYSDVNHDLVELLQYTDLFNALASHSKQTLILLTHSLK